MKALQFSRKPVKYAAAAVAGRIVPGRGAQVGPLKLANIDPPHLPGPEWVRVRPRLSGICGSDLATIDGKSSRYFDPLVSFPFTPGHEVVGNLDDDSRVVLEPVLGCVARNINPPCAACASGDVGRCTNIAFGQLNPGLQSGFCCDTGGGWSVAMVAHPSQLHPVPDAFTDEDAVMVEPAACALRGVLATAASGALGEGRVAVIGAGTLGVLTIAAISRHLDVAPIVAAKYPEQKAWASELGAGPVVVPSGIRRAARRASGGMAISTHHDGEGHADRLAGGLDVVFDCVGSDASLTDALAITRPGGRIVLVGMPATVTVDLTPLWQREINLVGAYAYGQEHTGRRTFDLAFELVADAGLGRLVTATYPLARYQDALEHAAAAGPRGAVKVAFDLRAEKERNR